MALVDIIIPTYNRASVLPETLKSVQAQTFSDWRCFIAEDGQSAETSAAIAPFLQDDRFVYLPGAHAGKPAAARNRAIRHGAAPFVAFLDDDDLWLPEKLEAQVQFMEHHPDCVLLGTDAYRWSGKGPADKIKPFFPQTPPAGKIAFETLVAENVIINSTAIVRRSVFPRSGLINEQLALWEDYEFWLRIASLGEVCFMEKPLALYRDAPQESIREGLTRYIYYKNLVCVFFAALRGSKTTQSPLSSPENKKLAWLCRKQLVRLSIQEIQRRLRLIPRFFGKYAKRSLLLSGRLLGKLISIVCKNKDSIKPSIFMIFPFYHTGGAERVHADIIACLREFSPRVFIVKKSTNAAFREAFARAARLYNIEPFCRYRPVCLMVIGCLAELVNQAGAATVFGCNTGVLYDMLPLLADRVKKVDLLHAFGGGAEILSLPYVGLLDRRIVINRKTIDDFEQLYSDHHINLSYLDRIQVIENKVSVPPQPPAKDFSRLQVLYVGRGTEEKRVHLVGRIARQCAQRDPTLSVVIVGDVATAIAPKDLQYCTLTGEIYSDERLQELYAQAHIIILTSRREGFPMVFMEAMAYGVVPISTDVGGIHKHLQDGVNGFLIRETEEENLPTAFVEKIISIAGSREAYQKMSGAAYQYAANNFQNERFCSSYRALLGTAKEESAL